MSVRILVLALLACLASPPASAVLLATGDGTGNTQPPADDPGWYSVGNQAGATAVYLGEGWVITANHVSNANPVFAGVSYTMVPGSVQQLQGPGGGLADLKIFRVNPFPPLPALALLPGPPPVNSEVVMIGRGRDRGAAASWNGFTGWYHGSTATMRWGTNRVSAANLDVLSTRAFEMIFSQTGGTSFEAQAATGDSGGAVFVKSGGVWYLAGILFAVGPYQNQPSNMALFGNATYAAQLSAYAATLDAVADVPVCDDGLDNDGDGAVDHPADDGCLNAYSNTENPACDDGLDNDSDGLTDLQDGVCAGQPWYPTESANACGLGFEVALLLPLLAVLRPRRRAGVRPRG